jgi:hypothetical protein
VKLGKKTLIITQIKDGKCIKIQNNSLLMVLSNQKQASSSGIQLITFKKEGLTAARLIDCKKQKASQFIALPRQCNSLKLLCNVNDEVNHTGTAEN